MSRKLEFREQKQVKEIPSWKDYSRQEWEKMFKNWVGPISRQIQEECQIGTRRKNCSTEYPCFLERSNRCYSLDGESFVHPGPRATELSHMARRQGRLLRQISRIPIQQKEDRLGIEFDQIMDRRDIRDGS